MTRISMFTVFDDAISRLQLSNYDILIFNCFRSYFSIYNVSYYVKWNYFDIFKVMQVGHEILP